MLRLARLGIEPRTLTYESGALPIAQHGPAEEMERQY